MKRLLLATLILFNTALAVARTNLEMLASGEHSFRTLGEGFYVDVPVRRIPDAEVRLVFVNRKLAAQLGIVLPENPQELERMLKDLFAYEVDPTKRSRKKWFATHYLDSAQRGAGQALGDGRALWTGELKLIQPDGKILYIDAVQKGVGVTPFAWIGNASHSDGKQSVGEMVYSGIQSIAGQANQLDTTGDLIAFAITRNGKTTTQTLRVGRQTRPAHIAFHDNKTGNLRRMMDYIIRRDLGLSLDAPVTFDEFREWQRLFALNNAEESARFYDLLAIQESPTKGNKTTTGGSIDLAGVRYFDAYHTEFRHLFGRLKVGDQDVYQHTYIGWINDWLSNGRYLHLRNPRAENLRTEAEDLFDEKFEEIGRKLRLMRVGLTADEADRVPIEIANEFFYAADDIQRALNDRTTIPMQPHNGDGIHPAAFDIRKVFAGTMDALRMPNNHRHNEMVAELFRVDRPWGGLSDSVHRAKKNRYIKAARAVADHFRGVKSHWVENAERINGKRRHDQTSGDFWIKYEDRISKMVEEGKSWTEITAAMEQGARSLTDPGLPQREFRSTLRPVNTRTCESLFDQAG